MNSFSSSPVIRLGIPPRLDCLPITWALPQKKELEIIEAPTRLLADMLGRGQLHTALLSPADVNELEEPICILPAGCVACQGRGSWIRVLSTSDPQDVRTLVTHPDNCLEAMLACIVWAEEYESILQCHSHDTPLEYAVTQQDPSTALLASGAEALAPTPERFCKAMDPGRLWFEQTGLPFPLFVWVAGPHCDLHRTGRLLLSGVGQTARERKEEYLSAASERGHDPNIAKQLLAVPMRYAWSEDILDGLEEFYHRAADVGLILSIPGLEVCQTD